MEPEHDFLCATRQDGVVGAACNCTMRGLQPGEDNDPRAFSENKEFTSVADLERFRSMIEYAMNDEASRAALDNYILFIGPERGTRVRKVFRSVLNALDLMLRAQQATSFAKAGE